MATVTLEHVDKRFPNGCHAVADLSLDVADGELLVLVGPSGCGKTTTLRMVAGLESASGGRITIGGRPVDRLPPKDRDVAMVFQHYALYPHLNVFDNMAFSLKVRSVPRAEIEPRVRRAAALLDIEPLLSRHPSQLSGGQRQRVAVGRAIVRQPACFLFDEPLSSLDPGLRAEMRRELKRLHAELKATILYVTHDQEEAMTLGDRVAVIDHGRLQQVGRPLDVYHRPANRFVAGFVGRPAMNFLEGTIVSRDGRLWLEGTDWRLPIPEGTLEVLSGKVGQTITLGIRPEDLRGREPHEKQIVPFSSCNVVQVDRLGDRTHVHLMVAGGGRPLVAAWDARADVAVGRSVALAVDSARLHFFGPDSIENSQWGVNLVGGEASPVS